MEKPTGSFTGIPPIDIPLHTVTRQGQTIPIALSYNAGGIKVEEIASSVGLGWNLMAGGTITRIKNGLPDETTTNGYLDCSIKPHMFDYSRWHMELYSGGGLDLEPDLFMFTFNGRSGRFAFDINRNIHLLDQQKDFIVKPLWQTNLPSPSDSLFAGFTITDDKGITYYFGTNKDRSTSATNYNSSDFYTTGWQLMQICDINGTELASFTYQQGAFHYEARRQAFEVKFFGGIGDSQMGCTPGDYNGANYYSDVHAYETFIKEIRMGGEKVVFWYGNRFDFQGALKADSMQVLDESNNIRKRFHFNYGYFTVPGASPTYDNLNKRLKLLNMSQLPVTGTDSITHSFTYIETENLPSRLTGSTDYWGFFNGGTSGGPIIPNGLYYYQGKTVAVQNHAERRINHAYTSANTLKRITFPSGGYREFTYEGNQVLYNTYYKFENIEPDLNDHTSETYFEYPAGNPYPLDEPAYTKDITINSSFGSSLLHFLLSGWSTHFFVRIIDKNGAFETTLAEIENDLDNYYLLPNGNYRFELYYNFDGNFSQVFLWWRELNMSPNTISRYGETFYKTHRDAGGLRISMIDDYDPLTNKHLKTWYKYYLPSDTTLSSGMLVSVPAILSRNGCEELNCDLMRISSYSAYPLNSQQGSYVCYPNVRVIEEQNGYTDQLFTFTQDTDASNLLFFPPVPAINHGYQRGQLMSLKHYDQSGSLIRNDSTEFYYQPIPPAQIYGHRAAVYVRETWLACGQDCSLLVRPEPVPKTQWSTVYSSNGDFQTKTEYTYNDEFYRSGIKRVKVTHSDSSIQETWYRYPYNVLSDFKLGLSTAERTMKDTLLKYNYLQPIETTTYLKTGADSILQQGTKNSWEFFHTFKKYPGKIKQFTSTADSTIVNLSNYDTTGNLREAYKTNNIKEVLLWGYNNKYVVAKVTGSDVATVSSFINNNILQAPSSDAALRTELNKIRTGLANSQAQVITYTHLPAVGISSITNEAGEIIFYEYDKHGRLEHIRDENNNIIKKIEYKTAQ
ncbi:hypothetical protein [Chitinophaga sp. YIM B06452]|uniref:hypothetical protein n=1 Tax=Chitinophaga sp. YIM B06452 TaxID=3082158 RepID=UPI0031FF3CFF